MTALVATTAGLVATVKKDLVATLQAFQGCYLDDACLLCMLQPCSAACSAAHLHCSGAYNSRNGGDRQTQFHTPYPNSQPLCGCMQGLTF